MFRSEVVPQPRKDRVAESSCSFVVPFDVYFQEIQMTARKTTTKSVIATKVEQIGSSAAEKIQSAQNIFDDPASAQEAIDDFLKRFGLQAPSWKRIACAVVLVAALAYGAGTLIGTLATYMVVGAFMFTGSMFVVWSIYILAILLALYAGLKIGQHVGNYVLSGQIDRDLSSAWNWTKSLFGSKQPELVQAAA